MYESRGYHSGNASYVAVIAFKDYLTVFKLDKTYCGQTDIEVIYSYKSTINTFSSVCVCVCVHTLWCLACPQFVFFCSKWTSTKEALLVHQAVCMCNQGKQLPRCLFSSAMVTVVMPSPTQFNGYSTFLFQNKQGLCHHSRSFSTFVTHTHMVFYYPIYRVTVAMYVHLNRCEINDLRACTSRRLLRGRQSTA